MTEASNIRYASMARRIQAAAVDMVIVMGLFVAFGLAVAASGTDSVPIKFVALLFPLLGYEPLLTWRFGGTAGYHLMNQRVCSGSTGENLNFVAAVVRYIVKLILGWLSLLFMLATRRHQALHDKIVNSIVVIKSTTNEKSEYALAERIDPKSGYKILAYLTLVFVTLIVISAVFTQ